MKRIRIDSRSKKIPLYGKYGEGKFALVSEEDYELLKDLRWIVSTQGYAWNCTYRHGSRYMHRLIMGVHGKDRKQVIDHINHDTLDNRRNNLRLTDQSHNAFHSASNSNSGYKNVLYRGDGFKRPWHVQIMFQRKLIRLPFGTLEEALMNRANIATQLWGEEYATFKD